MAGSGEHIPDDDRRGPDYDNPTPTQEHLDQRWKDLPAVGPATAISEPIDPTPANPANYTKTRLGYKVQGVIIHTTVGSEASAVAAFQNPARQASAHYIVACDGSHVDQCVAEVDIAWHCGRYYTDAADPLANVNTVGIEHCDNGNFNSPRPDGLYVTSSDLVRDICKRYGIPIDRSHIRKHREVSQLATSCPDSLDIDRIVAMAAGQPQPTPSQGEDEMLYLGPLKSLTGSPLVYAATANIYPDPCVSPVVLAAVAKGVAVSVVGYAYSSSGVQSADRGAGAGPGISYVWWKRADGHWMADADLDTTSLTGAPLGAALSTLPVASMAAVAGPPGKDGTDGKNGTNGTNGTNGIDGKDGKDGKDAPPHHHTTFGVIPTGPMIPD